MGGPTHKKFATFFAYVSLMLLNYFIDIQVNYYFQLIVVLPLAKSGALFPDVDHVWKNVKEKTTLNWILNKIIHCTGGAHRSRHTHSWDICLFTFIAFLYILYRLTAIEYLSEIDLHVGFLILFGFYSGWVSHLLSDMLSSSGVYLFCWAKNTVKFVPKKFLGFEFSTGTAWEKFCYMVFGKLNFIFGMLAISFPLFSNAVLREKCIDYITGLLF